MNLPWGKSPALSAQLERINAEMDVIDQRVALEAEHRRRCELNEAIFVKAIQNWFRKTDQASR